MNSIIKLWTKIEPSFLKQSKKYRFYRENLRMWIGERNFREKRIEFYSQFIGAKSLCFDIGANSGNRTDVFLRLGANVIAVEPQSLCVEYLEIKYKKYIHNKRLVVLQNGVGATVSIKDFYVCPEMSVVSTFSEDFKDYFGKGKMNYEKTQMELITLDELIEKYGIPDFIKIDVEGYEPEVMKGLSKKVKCLSLEYTPALKENLFFCVNHLIQLSENIEFNYSIADSMVLSSNSWFSKKDFLQLINSEEFNIGGDIYVRYKN